MGPATARAPAARADRRLGRRPTHGRTALPRPVRDRAEWHRRPAFSDGASSTRHHGGRSALLVVGDGSERQRLERLARATGISATFAGAVPDDDLVACLQAADIVCSPALGGESFGIVLLEAMAAGKPIVASRIEGYAELLGDADCARLVAPGEDGTLATELVDLITNEALSRRLGACGAEDVRHYDLDAIARRLVDIYRRAQAGSPPTRSQRP